MFGLEVNATITHDSTPTSQVAYLQDFPSFMSIREVGSSGSASESLTRVRVFWALNSIWYVVVDLYGVVSLIAR